MKRAAAGYPRRTAAPAPGDPQHPLLRGLNYRAHAERAAHGGHEAPTWPEVGHRANSALTGHLSPIVRPSACDEPLVAEDELVAVIGKPVRRATPEQARDAIFGWTIGNDVSARGWQRSDRTFWRCKNRTST